MSGDVYFKPFSGLSYSGIERWELDLVWSNKEVICVTNIGYMQAH